MYFLDGILHALPALYGAKVISPQNLSFYQCYHTYQWYPPYLPNHSYQFLLTYLSLRSKITRLHWQQTCSLQPRRWNFLQNPKRYTLNRENKGKPALISLKTGCVDDVSLVQFLTSCSLAIACFSLRLSCYCFVANVNSCHFFFPFRIIASEFSFLFFICFT